MASLSKANREVFTAYLRAAADAMGLRDWTLELAYSEPENALGGDATIATVEKWYGRRVAELHVRARIADEPPEHVRRIVTHELVHVPLEQIADLLDNAVKDELSRSAYDVFAESYRLLLEEAVDHIAEVLAPFMPAFPGWAEKRSDDE